MQVEILKMLDHGPPGWRPQHRLVAADGGAGPRFLDMIDEHGEAGRNVTELGGEPTTTRLSPKRAGNERRRGSVHVALGASAAIAGTVTVAIRLDAIIADASVTIDGRSVLKAGKLCPRRRRALSGPRQRLSGTTWDTICVSER